MDEILYLEADEEITSVIDKLDDLTGHSVALVVPKHAQLISSVVNLRLLLAEAKKRKKSISVVTQDKIGTKLASQVGIPVYASVTDETPVDSEIGPKPSIDDVIELNESAAPQSTQAGVVEEETVESKVPVKRYDESSASEPEVPAEPAIEAVPLTLPAVDVATPVVEERAVGARPQSSRKSMQKKALLWGGGLVVLAALLGAGWWFYWASWQATAIITLESEPFQQQVEVTIDNSLQAPDAGQSAIPGQRIETQISKNGSFGATGKKDVGSKASGTMTISNRLGEPVALASGTRFEREGLVMISTEAVTINAASVALDAQGNVTVKPGTGSVKVEASAAGEQYNLAPGDWTITSLTNAQRDKVTGANQAAFAGGVTKSVNVVTAEDIDKAKQSLASQATEELVAALQAESPNLTILKDGVSIEVVESSSDKQPNDEADAVAVTATVRARAIAFIAAAYRTAVVARVSALAPEGKQVAATPDDAIETSIGSVDVGQGKLTLKGSLQTRVVPAIDEETLTGQLFGKTVTEAQTLLEGQEGVTAAVVRIQPSIRTTLPHTLDRIHLEVSGS